MDKYSLSVPQRNIYDLQKFYNDSAISNICGVVYFNEHISSEVLSDAINHLITIQDGFRLQLIVEESEVKQFIAKSTFQEIKEHVFNDEISFREYAENFAKEKFEIIGNKLYRFEIIQLPEKTALLACFNHLIADAWTFSIAVRTVCEYIKKHQSSNCINVSQADISSKENENFSYVEYLDSSEKYFQSKRYEKDKEFWEGEYSHEPQKAYIKPETLDVKNPEANRNVRLLSLSDTNRIEAFCDDRQISPAILFETAVFIYLNRINRENTEATIGIPVLNRNTIVEKNTAGMFISTMPLTMQVSGNISDFMNELVDKHNACFRHQKYPYSEILGLVRNKYGVNGNLYDVMVSYQNATTDEDVRTEWFSNGASEVPLTLSIDRRDGGNFRITEDYQIEKIGELESELLLDRILFIVNQIVSLSDQTDIHEIDIIPSNEKETLINEFNNTAINYPKDKCIYELFEEQAFKRPEEIALIFDDEKFTYRHLNEMANSLAHYLREVVGIRPNDVVPIIAIRDWRVIVAMFAIMKAGGAYMPVDPAYPADRINYMLETAGARVALCYKDETDIDCTKIDLINFDFESDVSPIDSVNSSKDYAYILFTSGTTGNPKAVTITHRNLTNFCHNNNNRYQCNMLNTCKTVLGVTTFTFDISVFEIFLTLTNGLRLVLADDEQNTDGKRLAELVEKYDVDVIHSTPTKFLMYLQAERFQQAASGLKMLMIGAEAFTEEIYRTIRKYTKAKIYNGYGPSETTIGVSFKNVDDTLDITIGKPIANTQIYMVDKSMQLVPLGVAGELCIAGDGVGAGYLNRPELTKEKFVSNPFATEENGHGKILYKSGDLARWREDGDIEYLGRIDTQIKIRGLRVELGEIESLIASFEGVKLSAATDKKDSNGRQYLVGYYTSDVEVNENKLRKHLSLKLPKYMVPNYFVHLKEIPLTSSGKTDRKKLPVPSITELKREYKEPVTETEIRLSTIWEELLKVKKVGRTDDFFDLGGDSLLAITMLERIEDIFNVKFSMKAILENTELRGMAEAIDKSKTVELRIDKENLNEYDILPQQKAIYIECEKEPETLKYNMPAFIEIDNEIDLEKLVCTIKKIYKEERALHSYFVNEGGNIKCRFNDDVELIVEKYNHQNESDFVRSFDLQKAPLFRVGISERRIMFDAHHIIVDGTSLSNLFGIISRVYSGLKYSNDSVQFPDYAKYIRLQDFADGINYFSQMLSNGIESVFLPEKTKKATPVSEKYGKHFTYTLNSKSVIAVKEYGAQYGLTDTMMYFGIFGIVLSKYTTKEDIYTSLSLANRVYPEVSKTIGMFVNTLPVKLSVNGKINEYLSVIKNLMLNLYDFQELSYTDIAEKVGITDKTALNTSFVYQADGPKSIEIGGRQYLPHSIDTHTCKFDLMWEMIPTNEECEIKIEYNGAKYNEELIQRLVDSFERIMNEFTKKENLYIDSLSYLSDYELSQLISVNNGGSQNSSHLCEKIISKDLNRSEFVKDLFEREVRLHPSQVAVVFENTKLTYQQVDEMSNSLANTLRNVFAIHRNDIVPIISIRSWHVIVAMLAVIKAGGAYMLVDPTYPNERIREMIKISNSDLALVYKWHEDEVLKNKLVLDLDKFDYCNAIEPLSNVNVAEDLVYIIFTSGSTGKPKGIKIQHKNVTNYLLNNERNLVVKKIRDKNYKKILSITNFIFDIFVTESILPLTNGMEVYLANDQQAISQYSINNLIVSNDIQVMQTTPTRMRSIIDEKKQLDYLTTLKMLILGGEALTSDLVEKILGCRTVELFNIYGPAETTVWSTNSRVTIDSNDTTVTIGKPIANTQIYILDKNMQIVPRGVAGELCIAGAGVGAGYLNRPELTKEKFVSNPFATEENGHGKILYKTGDLARWREDGEIEYLGRIDTQIKIRGLRVELGEIESLIASFEGVKLSAATDKKDSTGRQYLVGYYTSDVEIDENELRKHLSEKLPKYMVPNYFVHLASMPLTTSGKTDRKNLPEPDFKVREVEYVAPKSELERTVCNLLSDLLKVDQVGLLDDFFSLGGDSLLAIQFITEAHVKGIEIPLQKIFDHPVVKDLCESLSVVESQVQYTVDDFKKYEGILSKNVIPTNPDQVELRKKNLGIVVLTGATGFLGVHILDELLKQNESVDEVYCLIREEEKFRNTLQYYFNSKYETTSKIHVVIGDITDENIANKLPGKVNTVIHAAASVKHYGAYSEFENINVFGTKHMVEYAKQNNARYIHISTISVSGNSFADAFTMYRSEEVKYFTEQDLFINQELNNVYIHSKFEAEKAVLDAILDGLDGHIVRVGNLTNRNSDYKFQPNYKSNAFLTRIKAGFEFGYIPDYMMPLYAEFSPIDCTAEGIVKIAEYADDQCVFNLNSNRPIYFTTLLDVLHKMKVKMEVVDGKRFNELLNQEARDKGTEYIYQAFQNDMNEEGKLVYDSNIRIINDFTIWFMKKTGFEWPQTDERYIRGYINYFRELGYLEV